MARQLIEAFPCWDVGPQPAFHHTEIVWLEDGHYYTAETPTHTFDLDALPRGAPLAEDELYAPFPPDGSLTRAPAPPPADTFVKVFKFIGYEWGAGPTPYSRSGRLTAEAHVYELLHLRPHPNLCRYYGCVLDASGMLITGLCLERHPITLHDALDKGMQLDRPAIIAGIRSGLRALHAQGLVHGDINPSNVMLDGSGAPVIIDFDSVMKEGEPTSAGTFLWSKEWTQAVPYNDWFGLALIDRWLRGEYTPGVNDMPMDPEMTFLEEDL